jgi:hypothetical protein
MAIGDAVAAFLGTATVNRQPASGVEEQISAIVKPGVTDAINLFDGTNTLAILFASIDTDDDKLSNYVNIAFMITNSVYIRKTGTTDRVYVGGVQTNV